MGSRYGLMVAVAAVFLGVFAIGVTRQQTAAATTASMCRDFRSLAIDIQKVQDAHKDEPPPNPVTGALLVLSALQKKHCS